MKKCPYCAEEIQDEAIKCRYCHSDLTVAPPSVTPAAGTGVPSGSAAGTGVPSAGHPSPEQTVAPASTSAPTSSAAPAATSAPASSAATAAEVTTPIATQASAPVSDMSSVRYTHSGYRYVLGYGDDFFGIWDRQSPGTPSERFPRTDDGWRAAWTRFAALEPRHVAVPAEAGPAQAPAAAAGTASPAASAAPAGDDNEVLQYTHSGTRYLLGYGRTFFGIWDRQAPASPVEKFARDDAGWAAAWRRFTQIEHHYTEVGLGGGQSGSGAAGS